MDDILKTAADAFVTAMRDSLPLSVYKTIRQEVGQMTGLEEKDTEGQDDAVSINLLRPIFEWLDQGDAATEKAEYGYPLAPMAADSIFPRKITADDGNNLKKEADSFFEQFQAALGRLKHKDHRTAHLWFENFESLMMLYMSALPNQKRLLNLWQSIK